MHCRAFSKKLEHFEAAVALNFASYKLLSDARGDSMHARYGDCRGKQPMERARTC